MDDDEYSLHTQVNNGRMQGGRKAKAEHLQGGNKRAHMIRYWDRTILCNKNDEVDNTVSSIILPNVKPNESNENGCVELALYSILKIIVWTFPHFA